MLASSGGYSVATWWPRSNCRNRWPLIECLTPNQTKQTKINYFYPGWEQNITRISVAKKRAFRAFYNSTVAEQNKKQKSAELLEFPARTPCMLRFLLLSGFLCASNAGSFRLPWPLLVRLTNLLGANWYCMWIQGYSCTAVSFVQCKTY